MNLDELLSEYAELELKLADPTVHANQTQARTFGRRYAELTPIITTYRELEGVQDDLGTARSWRPRTTPSPRRPRSSRPGSPSWKRSSGTC